MTSGGVRRFLGSDGVSCFLVTGAAPPPRARPSVSRKLSEITCTEIYSNNQVKPGGPAGRSLIYSRSLISV